MTPRLRLSTPARQPPCSMPCGNGKMEKQQVEMEGLSSRDDGGKAASQRQGGRGTSSSKTTYPVLAISPQQGPTTCWALKSAAASSVSTSPSTGGGKEGWWGLPQMSPSPFLGELMESCCIANSSRLAGSTEANRTKRAKRAASSRVSQSDCFFLLALAASNLYNRDHKTAPQPPELFFETATIRTLESNCQHKPASKQE